MSLDVYLHAVRRTNEHRCPSCKRVIRWALTYCAFCYDRMMSPGSKNPVWRARMDELHETHILPVN